jgi:hypothetical protein
LFYDKLAGGDVTKYDAVGELNYVMCLNKLALMQVQDEIQQWHNDRANKK